MTDTANTSPSTIAGSGIVIDSSVTIVGNQVIATSRSIFGLARGISAEFAGETVLIEGNQVLGWPNGINAEGPGKTVRKNQVSQSNTGIVADGAVAVVGNIATGNLTGLFVANGATATGNAAYGNGGEGFVALFSGPIEKNNIFGNAGCGISNFHGTTLADHNYWGSATGPGPDPADPAGPGSGCDSGGPAPGATTVTPFATKPFSVKASIKL